MNLKLLEVAKVGENEYGQIECKVGRRKMGFKEFVSLSFCDSSAGHVKQFCSAVPILLPTCYTHISFILAQNWTCKDLLEIPFNV